MPSSSGWIVRSWSGATEQVNAGRSSTGRSDAGLTRVLAFDLHQPDRLISTSAQVCGFVPMRGTAEQAEHHVRLDDDVVLKLDTADLPDEAALAHALTHPAHEHWTGVQVHDEEPAQHLDLWLTTNSPSSFGRLSVSTAQLQETRRPGQ